MNNYLKTFKPKYMWLDMEKAVESKTFNDFLKDQGVKLYQTYSEPKVSIAERIIRTRHSPCIEFSCSMYLMYQ